MPEIEWSAEQVCGECGDGVFAMLEGYGPVCVECGHGHPMEPWQLDPDRERYEWHVGSAGDRPTLWVTSYVPDTEDE